MENRTLLVVILAMIAVLIGTGLFAYSALNSAMERLNNRTPVISIKNL